MFVLDHTTVRVGGGGGGGVDVEGGSLALVVDKGGEATRKGDIGSVHSHVTRNLEG